MAKPRIFVSSTYYDLRHVREDVARFVREQGYEPVLFERGEVPYGRKESLQEYCYKEIETCDILVSIIGGRYGSQSSSAGYSITQKELRRALDLGKQVYIFVDKVVRSEYETYQVNKDLDGVKYKHVDSRKVYEFLDEVYALPFNNAIFPFESPLDIIHVLREQWAGLFQRLLQEEADRPQIELVADLRSTVTTLNQVLSVMSKDNGERARAIQEITNFNHPAFARVEKLLNISYRIVFTTLDELSALLRGRGYARVSSDHWDDPDVMEWVKHRSQIQYLFKVPKELFDQAGNLRPVDETSAWSRMKVERNNVIESRELVEFDLDEEIDDGELEPDPLG